MAEREEELKSLLMKLREEREKEKKRLKTQHSNNEDHGIWSRHVTVNRWGNNANSERLSFLGLQNHCRGWLQLLNWKILAPWKKSYDKCRQHIKNQRHHFADKGPLSQKLCFFPLVVCWCELDHKESWAPKNWYFWTMAWEKTLESPLDYKKIKPVNPKGIRSWIFIGKFNPEAKAPRLCPPEEKNWIIGKDPDSGKDWRQEGREMAVDEIVGWHHWPDGHESE